MRLILDASMALAWLFERVDTNEAACAEKALQALSDAETKVPPLWHAEISNTLLVAERRKVITEAQSIDYLNQLSKLMIEDDEALPATRRDSVIALAWEYKLTAYDATYLELALRINAVLATFDKALADAMRHAGGSIFSMSS